MNSIVLAVSACPYLNEFKRHLPSRFTSLDRTSEPEVLLHLIWERPNPDYNGVKARVNFNFAFSTFITAFNFELRTDCKWSPAKASVSSQDPFLLSGSLRKWSVVHKRQFYELVPVMSSTVVSFRYVSQSSSCNREKITKRSLKSARDAFLFN